jgi:plasmid replication initiation protein
VHIANDFSFVERKMINAIMADFQLHDLQAGEHDLSLPQLCRHINYTSRNREPLKEALETLVTTAVKWNIFERDKVVEWGVCTFLASAKIIRGGKVRYRVNEQIASWIRNPLLFAKFYLLIQTRFSKKHSLILYEFFVDELSRRRALEAQLAPVHIKELRALLGIGKDQYEEFKIFNRAVLKPAIEEINSSTDIEVDHALQRRARKAAAVVFSLKRKLTYQPPLALDIPAGAGKNRTLLRDSTLSKQQQTALNRLVDQGVARKRAAMLVETYDHAYIHTKIDQVEQEVAAGKKLHNLGGYLASAIVDDYQQEMTQAGRQSKRAAGKQPNQARITTPVSGRSSEQLQHEWERFRKERAKAVFSSLAEQAQEEHRQRYLQVGGLSGTREALFKEGGGWNNPIILHNFAEEYLVRHLLSKPEELSLDGYAEWRRLEHEAAG